jgi:hypothetical protein
MVNARKLLMILSLIIQYGGRRSQSRDLLRSRDHRVYHLWHFFWLVGLHLPYDKF